MNNLAGVRTGLALVALTLSLGCGGTAVAKSSAAALEVVRRQRDAVVQAAELTVAIAAIDDLENTTVADLVSPLR